MTLYLNGIGHFHPEVEISNQFLEELDIGTTDAWIMERVGIRTRRTVLPLDYIRETRNRDPRMAVEAMLYGNAETGRRAAEMAIGRAGIDSQDIGMVISGSCAPDVVTPAEACTIAAALGLEVPSFDVNSACTSFHVALDLLSMMDPDKVPRFVLCVVPEAVTRVVDYNDRTAAVLWVTARQRPSSRLGSLAVPAYSATPWREALRATPRWSFRARVTSSRRGGRCRCSPSRRRHGATSSCGKTSQKTTGGSTSSATRPIG